MSNEKHTPGLVVGQRYNVNGTPMTYRWSNYSISAHQEQHFFSDRHFIHTLLDSELPKFISSVKAKGQS
jgi:hypothetical protein